MCYKTSQLPYGDFLLNKVIIFERKTLSDFIVSIKDGRLFRQVYSIMDIKLPYILILEGLKSSIKKSGMSRQAVQGALTHLSVFLGIPILRSKNLEETIGLIMMDGKQLEKDDTIEIRRIYHKSRKARKASFDTLKMQLLLNLPGVGNKTALNLLKQFGSIKQIANCTEKDLQKVEGIGKKTAQEILRVFG